MDDCMRRQLRLSSSPGSVLPCLLAAAAAAVTLCAAAPSPGIHHIVVATKQHANLKALQRQASMRGYEVHVLGAGDEHAVQSHEGLGVKLTHMKAFCEGLSDPNDLVLFTDAFDTVLTGSLDDIRATYLRVVKEERSRYAAAGVTNALNAEIVVSGEMDQYPDRQAPYPAWSRALRFRFVNTGCMLAPARELLRLFAARPPSSVHDDQAQMTHNYLAGLTNASVPPILLDHDAALCLSMHRLRDTDFIVPRDACGATLVLTGLKPPILHGNGDSKDLLPMLCGPDSPERKAGVVFGGMREWTSAGLDTWRWAAWLLVGSSVLVLIGASKYGRSVWQPWCSRQCSQRQVHEAEME